MRTRVERGQLVVVDVAGHDHARQLARPLARRAHEHERQLARRVDERGDAPVRIGWRRSPTQSRYASGTP